MTRLLMLELDQRLIAAVSRALSQQGVQVIGTSSVAQAYASARAGEVDVALLDGDLIDEADLAEFRGLPLLVTTPFLEPEGQHRFFGHARLLRKPFTNAQLLSALQDTCDGLGAEPASLVDLLRRAHSDQQSLALRVGDAELFIEDGELIHAERRGVRGERALADVLAEEHQVAVRIALRPVPRTIQRPFRALMLDLLRTIDERERAGTSHLHQDKEREP
jgi:DNA-binding response OmpR family regulator